MLLHSQVLDLHAGLQDRLGYRHRALRQHGARLCGDSVRVQGLVNPLSVLAKFDEVALEVRDVLGVHVAPQFEGEEFFAFHHVSDRGPVLLDFDHGALCGHESRNISNSQQFVGGSVCSTGRVASIHVSLSRVAAVTQIVADELGLAGVEAGHGSSTPPRLWM